MGPLLFLMSAVTVLGVTAASTAINCAKAFPSARLTPEYNETIAHAIHSMTVEDLKLFSPKAREVNFVPTVNVDATSFKLVNDHAPTDPNGNVFSTPTMNTIDKILSSLGDAKDGLGPNWSPIERVVHVFHMRDLWHEVRRTSWEAVKRTPPTDDVCKCLVDVNGNGIKEGVKWVADHYKTGTPITLLNRPIPKLTGPDSWSVWRERVLHYYTPAALRDVAMYLRCVSEMW